mmetsp:Transcript_72680/g.101012  ORF Transcript_72680/g.101012 Transcript_72680/m.101012 type:complete len:91 (-) Transcript_72680:107-379(-)
MSRMTWIIIGAVAILMITTMVATEADLVAERSWTQCKESFVQQMISDECTPRRGIVMEPESGTSSGDGGSSNGVIAPPPDDGVEKVDRGN